MLQTVLMVLEQREERAGQRVGAAVPSLFRSPVHVVPPQPEVNRLCGF